MADRTKVVRGPCDLQIAVVAGTYVSLGIVGDVGVQITNMQQEQAGEPYGPIPFDMFHEGHDIRVTAALKETTREHFVYATGARGSSGYAYFEDRPGLETKYGLKIVPVAAKASGGTDPVTNYLELYQVVSESLDNIPFTRGDERLYNVTFRALIDTGRAAGRRIGIWHLTDNS